MSSYNDIFYQRGEYRPRCEHKNADHLLPGNWLNVDGVPQHVVEVEQFRCVGCGAWLSLGPSSDSDPRVQVEMRAAELADSYRRQAHSEFTSEEWYGRLDADGARSGVTKANAEYWAGWLAAAIANHDENREG